MKAVIYAGGLALRLINSFGKLNKHLLPLGNRAVIEIGIDQLSKAGITEILILTNKGWKASLKFLFTKIPKPPFIEVCASPPPPVQLADLLLEAEDFVSKDSFLLLLGDNFFLKAPQRLITNLIDTGKNTNKIILANAETCSRFGVPIFEASKISSIVEKPKKIESGLVVTGLAKYGPEVFNIARSLIREGQNTRALTDVHNMLIKDKKLEYEIWNGKWFDIGTEASYKDSLREIHLTGSILDISPGPLHDLLKKTRVMDEVLRVFREINDG